MCIAILNTKSLLPKSYIKNSWDNNYHGAGFAYSKGDSMFVYKTDSDANTFYKVYKRHRKENPDAKFLIHFRISTHGTITEDNLHPFIINDKVALIHNGTVDLSNHKCGDHRSDTRFLCEEILSHLPDGWHLSSGVHSFIKEIGGWSKFVLLDLENNHAIIKESEGHWDKLGNWFSNSSYKQVNQYIDYGGKKVKRGSTSYANGKSSSYFNNSWSAEDSTIDDNGSISCPSPIVKGMLTDPLMDLKYSTQTEFGYVAFDLHSTFRIETFLHTKGLTVSPSKHQIKRYATGLTVNEYAVEVTDNFVGTADLNSWYYVGGKSSKEEYGAVVLSNATVFGLGGQHGDKMMYIYPGNISDLYLIGKILRDLNAAVLRDDFLTSKLVTSLIEESIYEYALNNSGEVVA
jgi:predicted glutamine amidotransferase